jgi:hypothetical protein
VFRRILHAIYFYKLNASGRVRFSVTVTQRRGTDPFPILFTFAHGWQSPVKCCFSLGEITRSV